MKIDVGLVSQVGAVARAFLRGWQRAQRTKGRVNERVNARAFGVKSKGRRRSYWDDEEIFEIEDEMPGYQLTLPNDNRWYTVHVTPVDHYEVQFRSGRVVSEPLIGWLTQVRSVGTQQMSGTPGGTTAETRVVPGVLRDGELVNAAELSGFDRIEQI